MARPTRPDYGLLGNLADGILRPLVDPFLSMAEFANAGIYAAGDGKISGYKPRFQYDDLYTDPVGTGVRQTAGFGASLLPGTKFGSTVAGLAASGAGSGFANSDFEDPTDILRNVGMGAAIGGVTGVASKALSKQFNKLTPRGRAANALRNAGLIDDAGNTINNTGGKGVIKASGDKYNSLLEGIGRIDDPEQQKLLASQFLNYTPNNAKLTNSSDAIARSIYGADEALLGNESRGVGQKLINQGRDMQYRGSGLGFSSKRGLDFTGAYKGDTKALDKMYKLTGAGDKGIGPETISKLAEGMGNLRDNELAGLTINSNINDLVDEVAPRVAKLQGIQLSKTRGLVRDALLNSVEMPDSILRNVDAYINSRVPLSAGDFHDLSIQFGPMARKVARSVNPVSNEAQISKVISDVSKGKLKAASPLYKDINRAYVALYDQLPGMVKAANRGQISVTGGRAELLAQAQPFLERTAGRGMEKVGKVLSGMGDSNLINKTSDVLSNQAAKPLLNSALINTLTRSGENMGPQDQDSLDMGYMEDGQSDPRAALNSINSAGGTQMTPDLVMEFINAGIDPKNIQGFMSLQSAFEPAKARSLSANAQSQLNDIQTTDRDLQGLQQDITGQYANRFGPIQGGILGDLIGNLGLDPEGDALRMRIGLLSQNVAKSAEGGRVTDKDREYYLSLLPNRRDSTATALAKTTSLREMLANRYQNTSRGFQGAGYDIGDQYGN